MAFLLSVPCYKPHTQGANWGVKTLLFGLTLEIENCPGVRILMHKNLVIPPALRIHSTSNCSALKPGYPPPFTVGMCEVGGGGRQWLQRTGALAINTFIDERIETHHDDFCFSVEGINPHCMCIGMQCQ